ncbi:hypothetical protein H4R24_001743 [Coemansia sp. RSA 988]|nr:hypothetical protein H4R24_001743 [Coemansia sp. RSA 988]
MGRKRGSSNKKSRSKRSSTNTSPTNTPASFTAAAIGPPPSSVSEESNNSQPVTASLEAEETQNKEDGAPTATKVEPKAVADLDSEIVEEQPSEDVSTAAADGEALGPHTDDGQPEVLVDATAKDALVDSTQYNIDVASAVATSNCETEDLLDDIYTYGEDNTAHTETDMGEQPQLDACDEQVVVSRQNHTTDAAGAVRESTAQVSDTLGSLNLEDSEAVLLASNLEDSIYRSAINDRITDEMHVVEKSQESESMKVDHENAASVVYSAINAVSLNKASREYVVTPSAFATDSEPSVVTHVNQESATNAFDGETEAAADMVNIMSSEIYAAARAGGMETSTKSGGASNYNDWQMSESYVHVSQDLNSGK